MYALAQIFGIVGGPLLGLIIDAGNGNLEVCPRLSLWSQSLYSYLKRSVGRGHEAGGLVATCEDDVREERTCKLENVTDVVTDAKILRVRGCMVSVIATAATLIAYGVCIQIPSMPLQILTFTLLILNRVFYNGAISNLLLVLYPVKYFGTLLSVVTLTVAVLSFLQYPLFVMVESVFGGNAFWVNFMLLMTSLLVMGFPLYLKRYMSRLQCSTGGNKPYLRRTHSVLRHESNIFERLTVV